MKRQYQIFVLTIFFCDLSVYSHIGRRSRAQSTQEGGYLTGGFRIQSTQRPGVL
jgi:hypothetical protein